MTMHEPMDGADDERLFDAVLAEHWRGEADAVAAARLLAASPAERAAAWRRAAAAEPARDGMLRRHGWAIAAALLAVAVVGTMMVWQRAPAAVRLLRPQDPRPVRETKPRDLPHFLELLRDVKAIRLGCLEPIGATPVATETGSTDQLDVVRWPEVVRIDGDELARWREQIVASAAKAGSANGLGTVLSLAFDLADGSQIVSTCSIGEPVVLWPCYSEQGVRANEALRELLGAAQRELERLHRRAAGKVLDAAELAALPEDCRRVECPWLSAEAMGDRLARFPHLATFVLAKGADSGLGGDAMRQLAAQPRLTALDLRAADIDPGDLSPLAQLPELSSLALAGIACSGPAVARAAPNLTELTFERCRLEGADLSSLRECKRLRTLRLIDCEMPDASPFFVELVSLPSLAHLTLRLHELPRSLSGGLKLGKLQSLRLIDMPVRGSDLLPLAELPSLRELAVLSPVLGDADVPDLGELRQLTTLRLQNVKLTKDGLRDLQQALPKCAIDCVPGRRVFKSGTWILP